jgi:hypothetical protein
VLDSKANKVESLSLTRQRTCVQPRYGASVEQMALGPSVGARVSW